MGFLGTTTVTVIPRDSAGQDLGPGQQVFPTTTAGTFIGPVVDQLDGSYTQLLEADVNSTPSVVSAYANGALLANSVTVTPVVADLATTDGEIPVAGTMIGDHSRTHVQDFVNELIQEVISDDRKKDQTSLLEHKWTIPVPAGASQAVFFVHASRSGGATEGDDYHFSYSSSEGGIYTPLLTTASWTEEYQSVQIDPVPSGTVYIRVVDADRTPGNTNLNKVRINHMGIATISGPPVPGISVEPTSGLETTEQAGSDTFDVVLTTQPAADVTIGISSSDTSEGTVSAVNLTFTASDWDVPQTVTVTGVDDSETDGNIAYTILTAAAVSLDPDYDGLDAADVGVSNLDDEGSIPLEVDSVLPTDVNAGDSNVPFMVFGACFQPGATIKFENGSGPAPQLSNLTIVSDGEIAALISISSGGPPGARTWDVRVTNPDSSSASLPGALTVMK